MQLLTRLCVFRQKYGFHNIYCFSQYPIFVLWHKAQTMTLLMHTSILNKKPISMCHKSLWNSSNVVFNQAIKSLPFSCCPLMKHGGSVISSIVPRASLLPASGSSSQNSIGQTDRNSLPCRYQSPSLLTIILICAFPHVFTPKAPVPPAHYKKRMFDCDCCWQPNPHIHLHGFQHHRALWFQRLWLGQEKRHIIHSVEGMLWEKKIKSLFFQINISIWKYM